MIPPGAWLGLLGGGQLGPHAREVQRSFRVNGERQPGLHRDLVVHRRVARQRVRRGEQQESHRDATPVEVPFESYGTRVVVARKPGHAPARVEVELPPPWWQVPPFDLVTDLLWPATIRDRREPDAIALEQRGEAPSAEDVAARARAFRAEGAKRP